MERIDCIWTSVLTAVLQRARVPAPKHLRATPRRRWAHSRGAVAAPTGRGAVDYRGVRLGRGSSVCGLRNGVGTIKKLPTFTGTECHAALRRPASRCESDEPQNARTEGGIRGGRVRGREDAPLERQRAVYCAGVVAVRARKEVRGRVDETTRQVIPDDCAASRRAS